MTFALFLFMSFILNHIKLTDKGTHSCSIFRTFAANIMILYEIKQFTVSLANFLSTLQQEHW